MNRPDAKTRGRVAFALFLSLSTILVCFSVGTPSAAATSFALRKVAKELADGIGSSKNLQVAVFIIPYYDRHASDGPMLVSEQLEAYLASETSLRLVERQRVASLLEEFHLSDTGLLDSNSTRLLGKMLGADIIVTGTLIDIENGKTEINARGIVASTGRIIAASRALLDRTWETRRTLEWWR